MRNFLPVLLVAVGLCSCGVEETDDEEPHEGGESEQGGGLTFEGQLRGTGLPPKTLHLTYDDGPGARTAELAEYLEDKGIKATFFINGVNVPRQPGAIEAVVRRGHTLANHTQNHLLLPKLSEDLAFREIEATHSLIRTAQPEAGLYFRAPYAGWTERLARMLSRSALAGYVAPIHWDIGSQVSEHTAADWECWSKKLSVEKCGDLYIEEIRAKDHGIVLLHDIHKKTVDLTKYMVPKLRDAGYRFAGIQQVPSVRAASALPPQPEQAEGECFSGTLVKRVERDACVQSTYGSKWYRCASGEWQKRVEGDTCTSRAPLSAQR